METYRIPREAKIIARSTRIIKAKRIDREIYILSRLKKLFNNSFPFYLIISGITNEDLTEYTYLQKYIHYLDVTNKVIFCNGLLPFATHLQPATTNKNQHSVRDLLSVSTLSSFLTSYDYEGFGNPPAEAIATKKPYISTNYQLYNEIYKSRGFEGTIMNINQEKESRREMDMSDEFVNQINKILNNSTLYNDQINQNFQLGKKIFSYELLESKVKKLFPEAFI